MSRVMRPRWSKDDDAVGGRRRDFEVDDVPCRIKIVKNLYCSRYSTSLDRWPTGQHYIFVRSRQDKLAK